MVKITESNRNYRKIVRDLQDMNLDYEVSNEVHEGIAPRRVRRPVYEVKKPDVVKPDTVKPVQKRPISKRPLLLEESDGAETFYQDEQNAEPGPGFRLVKPVKTKLGLLGLFCIIAVAIYLIYAAGAVLLDIIINDFNFLDAVYYFVLVLIGIGALGGGIKLARSIILIDYVFNTTFENEIYTRLEPALREVAKVQVDMDDVRTKMERMNLNINRLRDNPPEYQNPMKSVEATVFAFLRYVILINISIAVLIYMLLYPSDFTPYILTILYPMWWLVITAEFKLWKVEEVWSWVFLPILVIPVTILLLDVTIRYGTLVGLIGGGLMLFAFGYRSWAKSYVEGISLLERFDGFTKGIPPEPSNPGNNPGNNPGSNPVHNSTSKPTSNPEQQIPSKATSVKTSRSTDSVKKVDAKSVQNKKTTKTVLRVKAPKQ